MIKTFLRPLMLIGALLFPVFAQGTVITLINKDPAGVGFNDATPFTPVGGNGATTLGQARWNALQEAARLMEGIIDSPVAIRVDASMASALNGPLGVGRAMALHHNFTRAPLPQVYYPGALADMLAGTDLDPGTSDIKIQFEPNEAYTSFYYGLDTNVPAQDNDFISVALHELTHGLGFSSSVDDATGKISGFANAFDMLLEQHGRVPAMLVDMTDSQRLLAIQSQPNLHWVGPNVVAVYGQHLPMYAPSPVKPGSSVSHFADASQGMMYHTAGRGVAHRQPGLAAQVLHDMGWAIKHQGLVNHPPIFLGQPNVFGGMTDGSVLRVQDAAVSDPDGDSVTLTYQWQVDGVDITGAVGATYTLLPSDLGKIISCRVRATDALGGTVGVVANQTLVMPATAVVSGMSVSYYIKAAAGASQYQWELNTVRYSPSMEDAETGSIGGWTVDSYGGYPVVVSDVVGVGSYSFHLARSESASPERMTLGRRFVPMDRNAAVSFLSRLGRSTVNQTVRLQVSEDGGGHWVTLWSQSGSDVAGGSTTSGETAFHSHSASLAAFVGKHIQLRFSYDYAGTGLFYTDTSQGTGVYLDNVAFTNMSELINQRVSSVASTGVQSLTVPTALRARAADATGKWGAWGADVVVLGPAQWIDLTTVQTSVVPTAAVVSGASIVFQGTSFSGANQFQWEIADLVGKPSPENAEDGGVHWVDGTDSSYPVVQAAVVASGGKAFHLAQPLAGSSPFKLETMVLQRTFQANIYSAVQFSSRLGWASADQYAQLEVSADGGTSWRRLWWQNGTGTAGETSFVQQSPVSLAAYAGQRIQLRFTYGIPQRNRWSYFNQVSSGAGFYFDDLAFTNLPEVVGTRITQSQVADRYSVAISASGVSLRMRASYFPGLWSDWGTRLNAWVGDSDGDGVPDNQDAFPFDPTRWQLSSVPALPAIQPPAAITVPSVDGYALPGSLPEIQRFLAGGAFVSTPATAVTVAPYAAPVWFPVGDTVVQFRAADSYGSVRTASSTITVTDQYADSDSDGLSDGWERHYFNTLNASDGSQDGDGDQLIDREEFRLGSDPTVGDATALTWGLQPGWNLVGVSIAPQADALQALLAQASSVDAVWGYHHGWQSFHRSFPASLNSLQQLQGGSGYCIHLTGTVNQSVTLHGVAAPPVDRLPADQQWHLLAVPAGQLSAQGWSRSSGSPAIWGFGRGQWESFVAGTPRFLNGLNTLNTAAGYYLQPPSAVLPHSLLGVTDPYQGWKMQRVNALAQWAGRPAVLNLFTDWYSFSADGLFATQLTNIWQAGMVPLVSWEPFVTPGQSPADIEVQIGRGVYDHYLVGWIARLKQWLSGADGVLHTADDRKIWLRPAHEMNGNWYPWSAAVGNNRAADYVAAWRHLHALFVQMGLDHHLVQWIWCVNNVDVGGVAMENYYPGDAYTDWVAIDGYNWGVSGVGSSWQTPDQVFAPMLQRLRTLTAKPVAITETASTTAFAAGVASVAEKATWFTQLGAFVAANRIPMVVWFNEDKETDWAMFGGVNGDMSVGGYNAFAAWKQMSSDPSWIPPMLGDTRLSVSAFQGR